MASEELRRGDLVEVKEPARILATLDERGALEDLPFMPEMAVFCGRRFVVDTSRNGAGPVTGATEIDGGPSWCNPPGRVLGPAPTADTGHPRADAFLWVKRPGESDGACRPGEPPAGEWWPEYALDLAKRS